MSDARARELERRWLESGAFEDEVTWLRELLRAGLVDVSRLKAALPWYEAAKQALGWPRPGIPTNPMLERAAHHVVRATSLRVDLALFPLHGSPVGFQEHFVEWGNVLDEVEGWTVCPCDEHRRRVPTRVRRQEGAFGGRLAELVRQVRKEAPLPGGASGAGEPDLRDVIAARLRAWCLGRELPGVEAEAPRIRAAREARWPTSFLHHFQRSYEVLTLGDVDVPSRWDPTRRVAPFMLPSWHTGPAGFLGECGYPGKLVRVPIGELVHVLLVRWAAAGKLAVPFAGVWAELDPLEVRRTILAGVSEDTVREMEEHMAWKKRPKKPQPPRKKR